MPIHDRIWVHPDDKHCGKWVGWQPDEEMIEYVPAASPQAAPEAVSAELPGYEAKMPLKDAITQIRLYAQNADALGNYGQAKGYANSARFLEEMCL